MSAVALVLLGVLALASCVLAARGEPRHDPLGRGHAAAIAIGLPLGLGVVAISVVAADKITGVPAVLAVGFGGLAGVAGGGPLAVGLLHLADPAIRRGVVTGPANPDLLRGGLWIGLLERAAVFGTLLAGFPAGLAVVLGVKGLGRYPDLQESPAAERFIIGTMTSLLWACGTAGTVIGFIGQR